jgi:hypothetical protein
VLDIDRLHDTERECGFRYPAALWAAAEELRRLAGFRPAEPQDIREARVLGLPESLVPFACERQPGHTDYYCCGPEGESAVAVFATHAVVAGWPSFWAFLEWVRQLAGHPKPAVPGTSVGLGGEGESR